MPSKSKHFCNHHGCNRLVTTTYCEEHAPLHERKDNRKSAGDRGYDAKWHRFRDGYIATHPLCVRCEQAGRLTPATVVHHKIPLENGGAQYDRDNLMAVCRDCHEIIHRRKKDII